MLTLVAYELYCEHVHEVCVSIAPRPARRCDLRVRLFVRDQRLLRRPSKELRGFLDRADRLASQKSKPRVSELTGTSSTRKPLDPHCRTCTCYPSPTRPGVCVHPYWEVRFRNLTEDARKHIMAESHDGYPAIAAVLYS